MRVLVCGGRTFFGKAEKNLVFDTLAEIGPDLIIHGGASGADGLAGAYAEGTGTPCMVFPAPWKALGRRGGPERNGWMLLFGEPDLVVAFPGGSGTANMVRQARDAGVAVRQVELGGAS